MSSHFVVLSPATSPVPSTAANNVNYNQGVNSHPELPVSPLSLDVNILPRVPSVRPMRESIDKEQKGGEEPANPEPVHVRNLWSLQEIHLPDFWRAVFAEFLATQFFVGFSVGGVLSAEATYTDPMWLHTFILFYHFILILIVIYAFGHLSGAHFNPAVSFGVFCTRRITCIRMVCYIAAQIAGGITGTAFMKGSFPVNLAGSFSLNQPNPNATNGEAFLMEAFVTAGLVFGTYAIAFDPRGWGHLGPVAIATIVVINLHTGLSVSGSAMNPARALGPAVITNNMNQQWIYWVGAFVGSIIAATTYEYIFMERTHSRPHNVPSTQGDSSHTRKDM